MVEAIRIHEGTAPRACELVRSRLRLVGLLALAIVEGSGSAAPPGIARTRC